MDNSDALAIISELPSLLNKALARIEDLEKQCATHDGLIACYMAETKRYMRERDAYKAMAESLLKSPKDD